MLARGAVPQPFVQGQAKSPPRGGDHGHGLGMALFCDIPLFKCAKVEVVVVVVVISGQLFNSFLK